MRDISIFYLKSFIGKIRFRFILDKHSFLATVHMYIYNLKIFLGKIYIPSLFREFGCYMAVMYLFDIQPRLSVKSIMIVTSSLNFSIRFPWLCDVASIGKSTRRLRRRTIMFNHSTVTY